ERVPRANGKGPLRRALLLCLLDGTLPAPASAAAAEVLVAGAPLVALVRRLLAGETRLQRCDAGPLDVDDDAVGRLGPLDLPVAVGQQVLEPRRRGLPELVRARNLDVETLVEDLFVIAHGSGSLAGARLPLSAERAPPSGYRQARGSPISQEAMGFSPASDGGSSDRRFRLGLLIALAAVALATVAAVLRGVGEMPMLSKMALGALYAAVGVVLVSTIAT